MSGRNPLSRIHRKSGLPAVLSLFVLVSSATTSVSQTLDGGWTGSFHSSGISVDASLVFVGECNRVQCLAIGAIFLPRGDTLTVNFAGSYDGRTIELNDLDSTATLEGTVRSNRAAMTLHYTGTETSRRRTFGFDGLGMRIPTKPSSGFIIVSGIVVLLCAGLRGRCLHDRAKPRVAPSREKKTHPQTTKANRSPAGAPSFGEVTHGEVLRCYRSALGRRGEQAVVRAVCPAAAMGGVRRRQHISSAGPVP